MAGCCGVGITEDMVAVEDEVDVDDEAVEELRGPPVLQNPFVVEAELPVVMCPDLPVKGPSCALESSCIMFEWPLCSDAGREAAMCCCCCCCSSTCMAESS